jgi:hypothetical protein
MLDNFVEFLWPQDGSTGGSIELSRRLIERKVEAIATRFPVSCAVRRIAEDQFLEPTHYPRQAAV